MLKDQNPEELILKVVDASLSHQWVCYDWNTRYNPDTTVQYFRHIPTNLVLKFCSTGKSLEICVKTCESVSYTYYGETDYTKIQDPNISLSIVTQFEHVLAKPDCLSMTQNKLKCSMLNWLEK